MFSLASLALPRSQQHTLFADHAGAASPAAASSSSRSTFLRSGESNKTLIVVDRHVHKTGGTTVRKIFQHAAAQGECMYWGYGIRYAELLKAIEGINASSSPVRPERSGYTRGRRGARRRRRRRRTAPSPSQRSAWRRFRT